VLFVLKIEGIFLKETTSPKQLKEVDFSKNYIKNKKMPKLTILKLFKKKSKLN